MNQNDKNQLLCEGVILQNGKYVIKERLSSGGFGNTYVVIDKSFEDKSALKEFFIKGINERDDNSTTVSVSNNANQKQFDSQKEKFKKEARRLRKLNNRHIVRVYDLFEENDTAYYVMDYIDGESLANRLKRTQTPLSEKEVYSILSQVLDALEEVHNLKIWHLDLKPGNILVDKSGNVVLIDFGASKQLSSGEGYETTSTSMCYTPGYAPSEQIDQNMDRIGPWTDFYALGATLYNLLTCTPPPTVSEIQEGNAFQFPSSISEKTKKLIEWMMTPSRKNRPQSVSDLRKYLTNDMSGSNNDNDDTILNSDKSRNKDFDEETVIAPINNTKNKENKEKSPVIETGTDSVNQIGLSKWVVPLFVGLIAIFIAARGCGNRAQAPVEEVVDSIAEVVDSVADSIAADSVVYESVYVGW